MCNSTLTYYTYKGEVSHTLHSVSLISSHANRKFAVCIQVNERAALLSCKHARGNPSLSSSAHYIAVHNGL